MCKITHSSDNKIVASQEHHCLDYNPKKVELPVKESLFVQVGRGEHAVDVQMATVGKIGLVRLGIDVEAIGVNVFNPDYVSFSLPISWLGDYYVNGELANSSSIYMPGNLDSFHLRSKKRDTIGVTMPRAPFIGMVAALRGIDKEDVTLHDRELFLRPFAGLQIRTQLCSALQEACSESRSHSQQEISNSIYRVLADAYLAVVDQPLPQVPRTNRPERVVRLAEEHFMATDGKNVSLADLCAAAGVGKSALYLAFNSVCDLPPLAYFQKRRWMKARSLLVQSHNERGLIKRTALSTGFTELGRFSVEYRQLFGESPSVTLKRSEE